MRFDQSSSVQPISEYRGGSTRVTKNVRTEILVSNIGFLSIRIFLSEVTKGVELPQSYPFYLADQLALPGAALQT